MNFQPITWNIILQKSEHLPHYVPKLIQFSKI